MTAPLVDDLAQFIRRVDGDNRMYPRSLGARIADFVNGVNGLVDGPNEIRNRYADFVERTNPDKRMGAGALAELIMAEFGLDKEN